MTAKKGGIIMAKVKRGKVVRYNKWGYIFLIPFVVVYVLFQLIPLFRTFITAFLKITVPD